MTGERDRLFGGQTGLAGSDPDLVGYLGDFIFDEVAAHGDLDQRTQLMCRLAALIAGQADAAYRALLNAALEEGVTPVEVKEIIYQAVPYLGLGKAYDFLLVTNEVLTDRGIELPLPSQTAATGEGRQSRGIAVQKEIAGAERVDAMYANSADDLLHLQHFLSANCFGDHYTRTGLELATRELITFVLLIAQGGCDQQVRGHVQGNLNVGNDRQLLIKVVTQLVPFIGYPRTLNAIAAINEIAPARA